MSLSTRSTQTVIGIRNYSHSINKNIKTLKTKYNQLSTQKKQLINNKSLTEKQRKLKLEQVQQKLQTLSIQIHHEQNKAAKKKQELEYLENKVNQELSEQTLKLQQVLKEFFPEDNTDTDHLVDSNVIEDSYLQTDVSSETITDTRADAPMDIVEEIDHNKELKKEKELSKKNKKLIKNTIIKYYRNGTSVDIKM